MSKKILVLTNNIGGLHSFRKEVVKAIVDAGYEVTISAPEMVEKAAYFTEIGCKVALIDFNRRGTNPVADLKLMLRYRKLIKRLRPVAVLTYTIKPNIYGGMAARWCGVPQIANVTGLGDAVENGGWMQKLTVMLYKIGLGRAHQLFFQNVSNRAYCISKGIATKKSVLLPGSGVNLQHHTYQAYPQDEGKVRFLFIGRMLKDKGIEEYFDAARAIKAKYPDTEFQILGNMEGDYQARLDALTKEGIVNHLGVTSDVRPYIGAVECTVMPSYHEGMSNVNLESAANGRPVITTDVPGCRETVDDGVTGILVKSRDTQSLTDGVEKFLSLTYDQKKQMGIAGRKKVEREFDREMVVKAYLNELKHIGNR
ncbi:MAG: glycosyltransferase family 4 protein [Prevotella sp.]|nr:glycosyltransferase family 4 protein [Prevotella sp.]